MTDTGASEALERLETLLLNVREELERGDVEDARSSLRAAVNALPAIRGAVAPAPAPESPLSSAWLIERSRAGSGPVWWAAKQYDVSVPDLWHFSPDSNHAVRFSRREDAEAVMRALGGSVELHESTVRVTEHIWLGVRVSERPAPEGPWRISTQRHPEYPDFWWVEHGTAKRASIGPISTEADAVAVRDALNRVAGSLEQA